MQILSTLMIIIWHILMHGNYINNCSNYSMKIFFIIVQFLIIIHVNSFILLSGFFQSNSHFKLSKLFNLLIQVVFYSELFLIIGNKMRIVENYSIVLHINNFLPSVTSDY